MTASEPAIKSAILPVIDLNRDRREERRQVFRRSRRSGTGILAIVLAAGFALLPLSLQIGRLRHELRNATAQAMAERSKLESLTTASGHLDHPIALWQRLEQTQQSRREWGAALPILAACLPQDVILQQVQVSDQDQIAEVDLVGSAKTMAGLRGFTEALQKSQMFAHVHLDEAAADTAAGHIGLSFRVSGPISAGLLTSAH